MGKKLNPNIIRIGDQVKIIKPEFVERVGYPMSFNQACQEVAEKYTDQINVFMSSLFPETSSLNLARSLQSDWTKTRTFQKIVKALAYRYIGTNGFGGNERKIYTYLIDQEIWQYQEVMDKAVVKTGFYFPPGGGYDYWGEYDWEPGGLDKEKTHILLFIGYGFLKEEIIQMFSTHKYHGWIEACNVEKIK